MSSAEEMYGQSRARSADLYERARQVMPGGVSHTVRYYPPFPAFIKRAKGGRIWDVDGNSYLDLWMGHYTHILGHAPDCVMEALRNALDDGLNWGHVNEHAVELAELICELVPSAEMVRFCCSGTEATMFAMRLARGYTNKRTILKVQGSWHGPSTELAMAITYPFEEPETTGIPSEAQQFSGAIPFNDEKEAAKIIARHEDDLAAVIIDPIVGVSGFLPPQPSYLKMLRDETRACGALLIFDEIITGFRVALGGAQEAFGVLPDLTTMGKVAGGGMPIGLLCGRANILEASTPIGKEPGQPSVLIGGGTFSGNHLSMVSGLAMLRYLRDHAALIYPQLADRGEGLRRGIEQAMAESGIVAQCTGYGSLVGVNFPRVYDISLNTPWKVHAMTHNAVYGDEMKRRLMNHGVFTVHNGGGLCAAHGSDDVDAVIEAYRLVGREMVEAGFSVAQRR